MNIDQLHEEFYLRISHNFREYVLLTPNGIQWTEGSVLEMIYRLPGYKRHKRVKFGAITSHIHIKFRDASFAIKAIETLTIMDCGLRAVLLDDMLRDWFTYEIKSRCRSPYSLTIVDVIGNPPFNLNFLTSNILTSILQEYGAPYVLPYTAALNKPHVQVLFHSMTEALAACMALGEWYCEEDKIDCFYYRVRINPCDKEEKLIRNCCGIPIEAYKLDYFVNIIKEPRIDERYDPKTKGKLQTAKVYLTKGIPKRHKVKCPPVKRSEIDQINSIARTAPILCIPIIAKDCSNTLSSNNQLLVNYKTTLSFQHTVAAQAVVGAPNSELESNAQRQGQNLKKHDKLENSSNAPKNHPHTRTRDTHRIMSRVFERRR